MPSFEYSRKLHWQHLFKKPEEAETHRLYQLIQYNSSYNTIHAHPKEQHLLFKQTGAATVFSFGCQSSVLPRSCPFFWQNWCSSCNSRIDLVVALEHTVFQLCSNAKQIFLRLARFKRRYAKRPAVVLTSHVSYTEFLLNMHCALQSGYVPNFCSYLSPMIVYLHNLFLFLLLECC